MEAVLPDVSTLPQMPITANLGRIIEPTMNFRWADSQIPIMQGGEGVGVRSHRELQQGWLCRETGEIEWRPVPAVEV